MVVSQAGHFGGLYFNILLIEVVQCVVCEAHCYSCSLHRVYQHPSAVFQCAIYDLSSCPGCVANLLPSSIFQVKEADRIGMDSYV